MLTGAFFATMSKLALPKGSYRARQAAIWVLDRLVQALLGLRSRLEPAEFPPVEKIRRSTAVLDRRSAYRG